MVVQHYNYNHYNVLMLRLARFYEITFAQYHRERGRGGVGGVITPGQGPRRGLQKIQTMKIYHIIIIIKNLPLGTSKTLVS